MRMLHTVVFVFFFSTIFCPPAAAQDYSIFPEDDLKEDIPLTEPYYRPSYIEGWLSRKVIENMSFTYVGAAGTLEAVRDNFTEEGYERYAGDIRESGFLRIIEDARMKIKAAPFGESELVRDGVVNGRYMWVYETPVVLTIVSGDSVIYEAKTLTAIIVRSNKWQHDMIAIDDWIVSEAEWLLPEELDSSSAGLDMKP
jgi:hypothetical protein